MTVTKALEAIGNTIDTTGMIAPIAAVRTIITCLTVHIVETSLPHSFAIETNGTLTATEALDATETASTVEAIGAAEMIETVDMAETVEVVKTGCWNDPKDRKG